MVLRRFLASFSTSPAAMLGAFEALRLPSAARHTALAALQTAVKARSYVFTASESWMWLRMSACMSPMNPCNSGKQSLWRILLPETPTVQR